MTVDELVSYLRDKSKDEINNVLDMLPSVKAKRLRDKLNNLELVGVA